MFGRYAIAIGRGAHRHALRASAAKLDLPLRLETPELLLVAAEGTACLKDGQAILVGQIFDCTNKRLSRLPQAIARQECGGDLRQALLGHWGNFALFIGSDEQAEVYREPSGSVAVFRCGGAAGTIFVSDGELALQLGLLERPDLDMQFVVHWLQFPFLRTRRTGLAGITEVLPGTLTIRTRSGDWKDVQLWHPAAFVGRDRRIDDPVEATRRLRDTLQAIVPAQPDGSRVVLRLSGGLDSSIIAACLAPADADFSCINFATQSRDGDERNYACDVARRFGLRLVEIGEPETARSLDRPLQMSLRPLINPLLAPYEDAVRQAANELGASLLVDGTGGDNLFCAMASAAPVLDALKGAGPRASAQAVVDVAARAGCTIWEVLTAAARRTWRPQSVWKEDQSFLVREPLLEAPELHPWLEDLRAPRGKREHVEALVHIQHFLDRPGSSTGLLHPLLAQPLLELCLRIPSWLWVRGGRDRAVARDAFYGLVPGSVLQRRTKGSLQSMLYRSFSQLRVEMRGLLVDGELVRSGIVDRSSIDKVLTGGAWKSDQVQMRISEMVALETWIQSWRSRPSAGSTFP